MKYCTWIVLVLLLSGCTKTRFIAASDTESYTHLMEKAGRRTVTIKMTDGQRLKGKRLQATPECVSWIDPDTDEFRSFARAEVSEITIPSRGRVSLGLIGVAVLGAVVTKVDEPECVTDACTVESLSYSLAKMGKNLFFVLLGGIGMGIGQAIEPNERYTLERSRGETTEEERARCGGLHNTTINADTGQVGGSR